MDPVLIAAILSLAGIVISTFGPTAIRVGVALISKSDSVAAIANEDVGDILPANSRLDDAMAIARAHEMAMQLRTMRADGKLTLAGLNEAQIALVDHALTAHAIFWNDASAIDPASV